MMRQCKSSIDPPQICFQNSLSVWKILKVGAWICIPQLWHLPWQGYSHFRYNSLNVQIPINIVQSANSTYTWLINQRKVFVICCKTNAEAVKVDVEGGRGLCQWQWQWHMSIPWSRLQWETQQLHFCAGGRRAKVGGWDLNQNHFHHCPKKSQFFLSYIIFDCFTFSDN